MSIRSSEIFTYNGVSSDAYGVYNINIESSVLQSEPFISPNIILEVSPRNFEKPLFQQNKRSVLVFNLTFAIESWTDDDTLREIVRWLCGPKIHKELYFSEQPTKKFFALYEGSPKIFHMGLKNGYGEITFRTNSPYAFSDLQTRDI